MNLIHFDYIPSRKAEAFIPGYDIKYIQIPGILADTDDVITVASNFYRIINAST